MTVYLILVNFSRVPQDLHGKGFTNFLHNIYNVEIFTIQQFDELYINRSEDIRREGAAQGGEDVDRRWLQLVREKYRRFRHGRAVSLRIRILRRHQKLQGL